MAIECGGFVYGISWDVPDLVNVYITNWKISMLLMEKLTIYVIYVYGHVQWLC